MDILLRIHCWAVACRIAHDNSMLLCLPYTDWISKVCADRMTVLGQLESAMLRAESPNEPEQLTRYKLALKEFDSPNRCCMYKSSALCVKCQHISDKYFEARNALEDFGIPLAESLYAEHRKRIDEMVRNN